MKQNISSYENSKFKRNLSISDINVKSGMNSYNSTSNNFINLHSRNASLPDLKQISRFSVDSNFNIKEGEKLDYASLAKQKLNEIQFSKKIRSNDISMNLQIKEQKATENRDLFISSKISSASRSLQNISKNVQKAKELESLRLEFLKETQENKEKTRLQRIANCINKPGVSSWMNLASGGRLKMVSPDLPLPSNNNDLKDWELFSGYLGPIVHEKKEPVVSSNTKDFRGFCYKLDPIYRNFTYGQVAHYLQLREKGVNKQTAIALSHKISCDLREKDKKTEKVYMQEDDNYDDLERRFEEFTRVHQIKSGEIIKNDDIYLNQSQAYLKENEFLHKNNKIKSANKSPIKNSKTIGVINIKPIKRKIDKELVPVNDPPTNKDQENIIKHSSTEPIGAENEAEPFMNNPRGVRFSILSIKPKGKDIIPEHKSDYKQEKK